MHICIAGNLGSGKSTICNILQKKHGFNVYSTGTIQRRIASQLGIGTLELNTLMAQDHHYDHLIDKATAALAQEHFNSPIIFDSRMAWKFVKDAFKVYMVVDPIVAAKRVISSPRGNVESYGNIEEALHKLKERALLENERFQQLYQVNNFDYRNYNLVIDSTCASPEKISQVIYDEYLKYCVHPTLNTVLILSPRSLFPLQSARSLNKDTVEEYSHNHLYLLESISVIPLEFNHYVIRDFPLVLAAAKNREDFLRTSLQDSLTTSELISSISKLSILDLYEFEQIGNFKYFTYPEHYRR